MLIFLDDLIVFSGNLGDLGLHRHAAQAIICSLDRPIAIRASGQVSEHACAYIPPGLLHRPDFGNGRAIVVYLALGSPWARRARGAFPQDCVTGLPASDWPRDVAASIEGGSEGMGDRLRRQLARILPERQEQVRGTDARVAAILHATRQRAGQMPEADLSQSRLRHLFVEETQVPFRRHRVWRRLETAMTLALTGLSLTASAHEAGFSDSAHLSRAFREMFGLSPSHVLAAITDFHDLRTPLVEEHVQEP